MTRHYERNLSDLIQALSKRYATKVTLFVLVRSLNSRIAQPTPYPEMKSPMAIAARAQNPIAKTAWAILISLFMGPILLAEDADNASGQPALAFARDVLPILSDHCFSCHGPDEASREAGLRLDLREHALKSNDGVAAIVPGQPTLSELIRRIKVTDDDTMMPPPDFVKCSVPANPAGETGRF